MPAAARIQVLPVTFEADGCLVHMLEVLKGRLPNTNWYHVVVVFECKGVRSKPVTLTVRSNEELKAKLLAEIAKFKLALTLYGEEFTRQVIS